MANNPFDKVYLSQANLTTIAEGGSITNGDDSYSADENAIYLVPDETGELVQTTGQSTADIMSQKAVTDAINTAISTVYKIQGSSDISTLNGLTKTQSMNGYIYDMTNSGNLTNQDNTTISVSIGDNVVFIWNGGSWKWDKLAGTIDLSGYVQKSQTIAGIDLQDNITASELKTALNVTSIISGVGAPTSSTEGRLGQTYIDTTDNIPYMCTGINNGVYTWVATVSVSLDYSSTN